MADVVLRFRLSAPNDEYMRREVGAVVTRGALSHVLDVDYTVDEAYAQITKDVLLFPNNFEFIEQDPPTQIGRTIMQSQSALLTSNGSSILVASGWVDVADASVTLSSKGSTALGVQFTAVGAPVIGEGKARILISGGSFGAGTVKGAASYSIPVLAAGVASGHIPIVLPSTADYTAYTVRMQMAASGILGSVTPLAGTALSGFEYR